MTINDFALLMMREQDEASDNSELVDVFKTWTEDAIDELLAAHDWNILKRTKTFTTDTINSVYTLDQGIREIRAMRFKLTNEPIDYVDAPFLYSMAEDLEQVGKPEFWFFESSVFQSNDTQLKIQFNKIPDAAYVIEYLGVIDLLSVVSSNINLPVQRGMFTALKHRVRAYSLNNDKDYEGEDRSKQDFFILVQRLVEKDNAKSANTARLQVRDISNTRDRKLARLDPNHFR